MDDFKINYNPDTYDKWNALILDNEQARSLLSECYECNGETYGEIATLLRHDSTLYRGELMICTNGAPLADGVIDCETYGIIELYNVVKASELSPYDWYISGIPEADRVNLMNCYGWKFRNPHRVIEFPVKGREGIFQLLYAKEDIITYPSVCKVDKTSYKLIKRQIQNDKTV